MADDWVLVRTATSPAASTYQGSWRRYWGEFTSDEVTPDELVNRVLGVIAQDGNCVMLSGSLWAPEGHEELSDHWYTDVTLGLNPAVYPLGTVVEPEFWGWVIGGIAAFLGFSWITKGSDGGIFGGISGILEIVVLIFMMRMIMPMMQQTQPRQEED